VLGAAVARNVIGCVENVAADEGTATPSMIGWVEKVAADERATTPSATGCVENFAADDRATAPSAIGWVAKVAVVDADSPRTGRSAAAKQPAAKNAAAERLWKRKRRLRMRAIQCSVVERSLEGHDARDAHAAREGS
jgi:hypothetical protein